MNRIVDISAILLELGLGETATDVERALAQACLRKAEAAVRRHLQYDPVYASRTEFYPTMDLNQAGRETIWDVNSTHAYARQISEAATEELQVRHIPIRQITDLFIDYDARAGAKAGAFAAETEKVEGVDFWPNYDTVDSSGNKVCRDGIIRSIGRWPVQAGSVKIVYTAGYTEAELHGEDSLLDASPIHEAVCDETTRRFLKIKQRAKKTLAGWAGPLASESLGDYSYSSNTSLLDSIVKGGDISLENESRLSEFVNWGHMLGG